MAVAPLSALDALVKRVIEEVRPYTMVPDEGLRATIILTLQTIAGNIPGDLVECGVWRGGSSFAMLLAQRYAFGEIKRPLWMYDSFQGMSPPCENDSAVTHDWYARSLSSQPDPDGQDYCKAPIAKVLDALSLFGLHNYVNIRKGWLADTLPKEKPEAIAVLRIDCDWYEPVKLVLEQLEPLVSDEGTIILDDYHAWAGCCLATHEYLTRHRMAWPLRSIPGNAGAWIFKHTLKESNV